MGPEGGGVGGRVVTTGRPTPGDHTRVGEILTWFTPPTTDIGAVFSLESVLVLCMCLTDGNGAIDEGSPCRMSNLRNINVS